MVAHDTAHTAIRADDCVAADASLVRAFDLLGKRWTGVLLGTLRGGPVGFRALARAVPGISDSVMSDRLGELASAAQPDLNLRRGGRVASELVLCCVRT